MSLLRHVAKIVISDVSGMESPIAPSVVSVTENV